MQLVGWRSSHTAWIGGPPRRPGKLSASGESSSVVGPLQQAQPQSSGKQTSGILVQSNSLKPQSTGVENLWTPAERRRPEQPLPTESIDEEGWWKTQGRVDFDDKVAYRLFGKQIELLCTSFSSKRQLYVSTWRGTARLRDLSLNAAKINALFNPLAEDADMPIQLVGIDCERVSVAWRSIFSLWREPLEIQIPRLELIFDASAERPEQSYLRRIRNEWKTVTGPEPTQPPKNYPPVEGARYVIGEVVCLVRRYPTPFAGCRNATVRLVLRNVEALSVDRDGQARNLRACWLSFNSPSAIRDRAAAPSAPPVGPDEVRRATPLPKKKRVGPKPLLVIAKRIVATDVTLDLASTDPDPSNATYITRLIDSPRAAALVTVGYNDWNIANLRCDVRCDQLDLDLPEPTLTNTQHARDEATDSAAQTLWPATQFLASAPTHSPAQIAFRFRIGVSNATTLVDRQAAEALEDDFFDLPGALLRVNNSILRPLLAITIFLWSLRLI